MEGRSFSIYTYSKFRKKYLMARSPGKNNWRRESREKNICVSDENTRPPLTSNGRCLMQRLHGRRMGQEWVRFSPNSRNKGDFGVLHTKRVKNILIPVLNTILTWLYTIQIRCQYSYEDSTTFYMLLLLKSVWILAPSGLSQSLFEDNICTWFMYHKL